MKKPPSSGPATEASPNAAPMSPMKRARSRAGTMSAMMAWTPIMSPAGADALDGAEGDELVHGAGPKPASAEPMTKTTIANWKTPLRPKRSPSLP